MVVALSATGTVGGVRRLLLLVAVSCVALTAVLAVSAFGGRFGSAGVDGAAGLKRWEARARACVGVSDVTGCTEALFLAAGRSPRPLEAMEAMNGFLHDEAARNPVFSDACHMGGHLAGKQMAAESGDPVKVLAERTIEGCFSGLAHGVFDAVGRGLAGAPNWARLAAVCEQRLQAMPGLNCPDGMGHAAWDATTQRDAAYRICEHFTLPGPLEQCAEGIVMQRFAPATERDSGRSEPVPTDVASICAGLSGHLLSGCFSGVGWLMGHVLLSGLEPITNAASQEYAEALVDPMRDVVAGCSSLGEGADGCFLRFVTTVPVTKWDDPVVRDAFCSAMGERAEFCLAMSQRIVGVLR